MHTNETKAVVILREIIDRLKALVESQDKEIARLREQVSDLEKKLEQENKL